MCASRNHLRHACKSKRVKSPILSMLGAQLKVNYLTLLILRLIIDSVLSTLVNFVQNSKKLVKSLILRKKYNSLRMTWLNQKSDSIFIKLVGNEMGAPDIKSCIFISLMSHHKGNSSSLLQRSYVYFNFSLTVLRVVSSLEF